MPPEDIAVALKKGLRRLNVAAVVLALALAGVLGFVWWQGIETRDALCSLRADAERRLVTSQEFLKENPNGIPGISAEALRNSIANSQRTVDSLSGLNC